jgi:hypothetical protein
VYFGVSPWWWGGYPYWGYPYYGSYGYYGYGYPAYSYAYPYPAEDQVYVERGSEGRGYWYYCESKRGYYPDVPECPEDWIKVPPTSE